MDERCKSCLYLCKRLDSDDQPRCYRFKKLAPNQIVRFIHTELRRRRECYLRLCNSGEGAGDQLALLFTSSYPGLPGQTLNEDNERCDILVIAQSEKCGQETVLWFCYGMPESCCNCPALTSELTETIQLILDSLAWWDNHLTQNDTLSPCLPDDKMIIVTAEQANSYRIR